MSLQVLRDDAYLFRYWQSFISGGETGTLEVGDIILRSWSRCIEAGVSPWGLEPHSCLKGGELRDQLRARLNLLNIARPFMTDLYKIVRGTGFVVVLANESGSILEFYGDAEGLRIPLTRDFFVGASWHEHVAGTNAIGTAIEEQGPVQVTGAEHFREKHHGLTCSAAPIFDPIGNLIGVINISGAWESAHKHTLGIVVAAAKAISAHLRISRKNHQLAVANKKLVNFFNMVSDGVLILDQYGNLVELNPAAERIFQKKRSELTGLPFPALLHRGSDYSTGSRAYSWYSSRSETELTVETATTPCRCLATTEPIVDEQENFDGSFITLRPVKEMQNLVNRYSGYSASLQFSDIIARSPEMKEALELARLSAGSLSNVLLQGESGTGKEIFAQAIHNLSSCSSAPFIPLNCGAIPRELVGSELFGYEDGAFTGAKKGGKPGKFELASGGTLFLDEIGDMPLEQQAVLLRVIQEKMMTRIGGLKVIPVDARLICATHKNLLEKVHNGTFRQDLYYRLNVMSITIPPLRDRKDDIEPLFSHFIEKLCRDRGATLEVDRNIMHYLYSYQWPGNVRELQNVVERAANLAINGTVGMSQLPSEIIRPAARTPEPVIAASLSVNRDQRRKQKMEQEKHQLLHLLDITNGNISKVARELGVSRKTVYSRMSRYHISN